MATVVELPIHSFEGIVDPDWCPGCGDFGVLKAVKVGASKAGVLPKDLVLVSGIGCSSNLPGYVHAYGVHSLHGRSVAVATGIKLANTSLKVVITGGDGDGYGIGIGHFIHAMRRNLDLTYVVMDNQIYGLTTGQASPTTMKDARTKSTPQGNVEAPLNPLALALVSGATYVARGFSGEPNHLADLIAGGIQHKGFALIDVFQPLRHLQQAPRQHLRLLQEALLPDSKTKKGYDPSNAGEDGHGKRPGVGRPHSAGVAYKDLQPTYEDMRGRL